MKTLSSSNLMALISATVMFLSFVACEQKEVAGPQAPPPPNAAAQSDLIDKAVETNDVGTIVKFAKENPSGIEWRNDYGNTLLHSVCESPALVKALLPLKPDLNARNHFGYQPLHFAVKNGNLEVVKALVEAGADVHSRVGRDAEGRASGETVLMYVAHVQNVEPDAVVALADYLFAKAPRQLNLQEDELGYTPLMFAADRGNLAFAKWLLAKGADKTIKNRDGLTAAGVTKQRFELIKENNGQPEAADLELAELLSK